MEQDFDHSFRESAPWATVFFTKLYRYRALLKRRWWILLLTVSVCLCIQGFRILNAPSVFSSFSRMMVSPKISVSEKVGYSEELNNFFGTQTELMQSGQISSRALARLKAAKPDLKTSEAGLKVSQTPRTSIFIMQAYGSDPVFIQAYLDAVMEEFIRFKSELREDAIGKSLSSLLMQLTKVEKDLEKSQADLFDYQKENDSVILREQGKTASEFLIKMEEEIAEKKKEYQLLESITDQKSITDKPSTDTVEKFDAAAMLFKEGPEATYLNLKKEVELKRIQADELAINLKANHPKLVKLREEIADMDRVLTINRTQGFAQLKARKDSLGIEIANTERVMKDWESKALNANQRMTEYERLRSNMERIQQTYNRLLDTSQNIKVGADSGQGDISVLEYASPATSAKQGGVKSLAFGLMAGLAAGLVILFVLDRIDDRVNSLTEYTELFREELVGQIPREPTPSSGRVGVLKADDERHAYAEAFRNIRSSLLYMQMEGERPKSLLVTSAIPGEGKSTVACNLALTLAFSGSKVLLIDADLRRGVLHQDLKKDASPGLSEIISKQVCWKEVVKTTEVESLHFIARGKSINGMGELLLGNAAQTMMRETRETYDYVIYDTPPILVADDTPSMAPKMDGVLMVMQASYTSSRMTRNSLNALYQRQVRVLGVVFNCIDINLPDYDYYQYAQNYH